MTRPSSCPAAAAPLLSPCLLPLLLLLLSPAAHAQEIKLVSGPGCADLVPDPPTMLTAAAGDGSVVLSWNRPSNGACVTEYQITVWAVDAATGRSASQQPRQQTPGFSVTISGLTNGVQYKFLVCAFSAKHRAGGEAQTVATPQSFCDPRILPSAPTALRATTGVLNVTLCWGPPAVAGCVDEWRVAVVPVQRGGQRSGAAAYRRYNKGGCVTIDALTAGQPYNFSVQAWSNSMRGGSHATVQATPLAVPQQWRCLPVPGFYPLCSAAAAGMCTPLNCQAQFAKGQCSAPFMRIVDPASLTIVQHCSDLCGCSADPALGTSSASSSGTADAAARAAAGTTGTTSGWASPAGCCTTPPRSRAFAGYELTPEEVATAEAVEDAW